MSTNSGTEGSASPPSTANAPKFGTLVPNRIFVGGISANTTEVELQALFSNYGNVKGTKIISDRAGISKGYGFVTFETEEEALKIQKDADHIVFKDRKLNIAPAIKKQPFTRVYENTSDSSPVVPNGTVLFHNGVPYTYHNGMAFFTSPDSVYQYPQVKQTTFPLLYSQPVYVPQQYQATAAAYQTTPAPAQWTSGNQWRWAAASAAAIPAQYLYATVPTPAVTAATTAAPASTAQEMYVYSTPHLTTTTSTQGSALSGVQTGVNYSRGPLEFAEMNVETNANEVQKPYSQRKPNGGNSGSPRKSYQPNSRMHRNNGSHCGHNVNPCDASVSRTIKQIQTQQPHLVPKTMNGVTIMAINTPHTIAQEQGEDAVTVQTMPEFSIVHAPNSCGTPLTPPPTPLIPMTSENILAEANHKLQTLTL